MIAEIVFDKICYFKNAIADPKKWLEEVDLIDDKIISPWVPWESNTYDGGQPWVYGDRKFATLIGISDEENNTRSAELVKEVLTAMEKCALEYAKIYNIDIGVDVGPVFVLNKYKEGEEMGQHIDWNEDQSSLEYSFVVYMNDDYEGGEIWFENQMVSIKPEAGSIVIFPSKSPYSHGSKKLESGRKIFIPHFWRSGIIKH